jgi:hypothetical protein
LALKKKERRGYRNVKGTWNSDQKGTLAPILSRLLCWKLETTHTLRERMKRKRDNKLIEDFVFFYST